MDPAFAYQRMPHRLRTRVLRVSTLALALGVLYSASSYAQPQQRSVPAEYLRSLRLPGTLDQFKRPNAITVDRNSREILVADGSNNRIVIFDENGVYRFEFGGRDDFSTPFDVAVDTEGFIFVLRATHGGRQLTRYEFDGTDPVPIPLPQIPDGEANFGNFCIDQEDRLYLLEERRGSIFVVSRDGELLDSFDIDAEDGERGATETVVGSLHADGGLVYVPLSSYGTVQAYDVEGQLVRSFGYRGNNVGELNFPVAVTVKDDGMVMVLDKHRFNVLCFAPDGRFLGEFGGKGMRPGWFYHPTLLAVDHNGLVYIGQIYDRRVDVCQVPGFIGEALTHWKLSTAASSEAPPLRVTRLELSKSETKEKTPQ